jgi:ADP-heptose:LPS heptosyltransferase
MVHLAAATDTPAVVIFGPTPTETFLYPWHRAAGVRVCTPCWGAEPMWSAEQCAIGLDACGNFPSPTEVMAQLMEVVGGRD